MKQYILIAGTILIVLFSLLVWVQQEPAPLTPRAITVPQTTIEQTVTPPEVTPPTPQEEAVVELTEPQISDASSETITVLENTQDEEPRINQPNLEGSDTHLISYISTNLDSGLTQLLVKKHILRKFVRAINSLEEGKVVSKYRPTVQPQQAFVAKEYGKQWIMSSVNYARYTPYITTLENMGANELILAYNNYYETLVEAYQELGVNKGEFKSVTRRALQQLIDAPEYSDSPILTHKSVMYKYQDKEIENLPAAQKLMIRLGPNNSKRLKALLTEIVKGL